MPRRIAQFTLARFILAAIGMMFPISLSAFAQSTEPASGTRSQPTEWVVLETNRCLEGRVTRTVDHVEVRTLSGSRIMLPSKRVVAICETLEEVYEHRVDQLAGDDIAGHVSLLHWCLKHNRHELARQQLKTLEKTDLGHRRIAFLQRRVEQSVARAQAAKHLGAKLASDTKDPFAVQAKFSQLPALPAQVASSTPTVPKVIAVEGQLYPVAQVTYEEPIAKIKAVSPRPSKDVEAADAFDPAAFNRQK